MVLGEVVVVCWGARTHRANLRIAPVKVSATMLGILEFAPGLNRQWTAKRCVSASLSSNGVRILFYVAGFFGWACLCLWFLGHCHDRPFRHT